MLQIELVDAQRIAEERARELAVANSLVAEKTREYTELQRFVTESEQSANAMDEKFKLQLLETKQERYVNLLVLLLLPLLAVLYPLLGDMHMCHLCIRVCVVFCVCCLLEKLSAEISFRSTCLHASFLIWVGCVIPAAPQC